LSRVSVPISLRQQPHLAFIPEFNVQMLHLPGLKNVVANLLSRPSLPFTSPPPPPPESDKTVAFLAAADPVDFEAMAAKQNRCAETQCLLCGSSIQLAFHRAGT
jgi:hypothetical protein